MPLPPSCGDARNGAAWKAAVPAIRRRPAVARPPNRDPAGTVNWFPVTDGTGPADCRQNSAGPAFHRWRLAGFQPVHFAAKPRRYIYAGWLAITRLSWDRTVSGSPPP